MPISQTAIYNLKAVLKETGVGGDTLRAWERRYGLPMPQRTPGGHRLYSQRDIQLIKWLLARQGEGLSISRAVKRWNELAASGEDPLAEANMSMGEELAGSQSRLNATREEWLAACLRFDEATSEQVLNQAFAIYSVETVVTEIIVRSLREVGERWQRGQATVPQEHFVSALAMRHLQALIAASPIASRPAAIVLACPPGELHSLPLLYLDVMLRRRGRNVIFLGADVPVEDMEDITRNMKAALVVMGAQRLTTAVTLRDAAALLAKRHVPVAYGGQVFNQIPELREQIAGEFLGEEVEGSFDRIGELLARPSAVGQPSETGAKGNARAYRSLRSEIEATLHRHLDGQADVVVNLTIANSYFGSALAAALELGNIAYLGADMAWIGFLLTKPRLPFETPRDYLLAYSVAVRRVMAATGGEIADWLEHYAGSI